MGTTPGIYFEPGATIEQIYQKLESFKMIARDERKKRILVLPTILEGELDAD